MTDTTLNIGVIGAGAIGINHINSINAHPRAKVVAIAEPSEQRRQDAAERFGLKGYADHHAMLAAGGIDAATVALPNYLHAPVAIDVLKAGLPVMLDKPFATSYAEAASVVEAGRQAGKSVSVGMNQRYTAQSQTARRVVASGRLGEVYHAHTTWLRRSGIPKLGTWFTQKQFAGGGCLYDIGVHALDRCLFMLGNFSPVSVFGFTHAKFGPRGLGEGGWGKSEPDPSAVFDVDDFAGAMIRLANGCMVHLEVSWARHQPGGNDETTSLYGTEALLQIQNNNVQVHKPLNNMYTYSHNDEPCGVNDDEPRERMLDWVDHLLTGKPTLVKLDEALTVQKILDAIYESARTGQAIDVSK